MLKSPWIRPRKERVVCMRDSNIVGYPVQTHATFLVYASMITKQKKCRGLLDQKFDAFKPRATTFSNSQQHPKGSSNESDMSSPTMLDVVGQHCLERLQGR